MCHPQLLMKRLTAHELLHAPLAGISKGCADRRRSLAGHLMSLPGDWADEWSSIKGCQWPRLAPLLQVFGQGEVPPKQLHEALHFFQELGLAALQGRLTSMGYVDLVKAAKGEAGRPLEWEVLKLRTWIS